MSVELKKNCPKCGAAMAEVSLCEDGATCCPHCGETVGPASAPPANDFGRFQLLEQLGRGAFGEVWAARDRESLKTVALKVSWRMVEDQQARHLLREASATIKLSHPNIAKVHEVGRQGDRVFVVSDLVEGITLDRWREEHRPPPREAIGVCGRLATVLQHAHELGIVHRDLKPSNVMIGPDGEPYLLDFGLARNGLNEASEAIERYQAVRQALRNSRKKSSKVRIMGTPAYMSPEQAAGRAHSADARSDIYSLGVILYELLTGQRPFNRRTDRLVKDILHKRPKPPRRIRRGIPRDVQTICLHAMAKKPKYRYQTAAAMADDCARAAAGERIAAPTGLMSRLIWPF